MKNIKRKKNDNKNRKNIEQVLPHVHVVYSGSHRDWRGFSVESAIFDPIQSVTV